MIAEIMDRISPNNSRAWLLLIFFFAQKWGDYSREAILLTESRRALFFVLFWLPLNQKMITPNKLNMGLSKCSKFGSFRKFECQYPRRQSLNRHWSCFAGSESNSTLQGGYKKKRRWGRGGLFFEAGDYFQYFRLKGGDYSRDRRLIEGRLLFEYGMYMQ